MLRTLTERSQPATLSISRASYQACSPLARKRLTCLPVTVSYTSGLHVGWHTHATPHMLTNPLVSELISW